MEELRKVLTIGTLALVVIMLVGVTILPPLSYAHLNVESDGQENAEYSIKAGYNTHWSVVSLDNGEFVLEQRYIAVYDTEHVWFKSNDYIENTLSHLEKTMSESGLELESMTTDETLDLMSSLTDKERIATTLVFMTGSLPSEIYDGSMDCPIVYWLTEGGNLIWGSGPLGRYISTTNEYGFCSAGDMTMFGYWEASSKDGRYDERIHEDCLSEALRIYFNNCSYGVKQDLYEDQFDLDYSIDGYGATTVMRYYNGTGNMIIIGGDVDHHNTDYVKQMMMSGLNYRTQVVDWETGISDSASGKIKLSQNGTVVITLGMMKDYITERFQF